MRFRVLWLVVLATLFVWFSFSGAAQTKFVPYKMKKEVKAPRPFERPLSNYQVAKGTMSAPNLMNSVLFDSARNGYGWYVSQMHSVDLAVDASGKPWVGACYRKYVPGDPNTGIIGVMELDVDAGFSYDNMTFFDYINNLSPYGIGGRYPSFVATDMGPVPVWNQYMSGSPPTEVSDGYISFDLFGWGPFAGGFINPVNVTPNPGPGVGGLWLGSSSVVKDASGTYHYGGVWECHLNEGDFTWVHGTSTDLSTWTFNDAVINWPKTLFEMNNPIFYWGTGGFGAWMSTGYYVGSADQDFKVILCTTDDYGQTWNTPVRFEWSDLGIPDQITLADSIINPETGTYYVGPAELLFTYDFDMIITPDNVIHFVGTLGWGVPAASGGYYPHPKWSGFWHLYSADHGQTWNMARIYWPAGFLEGDSLGNYTFTNEIDISYDEQGNLYTAWVDRGRTDLTPSPVPRRSGGDDFNLDLWASLSKDGGVTWSEPLHVVEDNSVCVYGVRLSTRAKWYESDNGKTYIGYMIADLSRPLPPPVEMLADHVQWYYLAEAKNFPAPWSSIEQNSQTVPTSFTVFQNYPNPFNPQTNIKFLLNKKDLVDVAVYNVLGEKVAQLHRGVLTPGEYTLTWDASSQPSGIYILKVSTSTDQRMTKMVLVK